MNFYTWHRLKCQHYPVWHGCTVNAAVAANLISKCSVFQFKSKYYVVEYVITIIPSVRLNHTVCRWPKWPLVSNNRSRVVNGLLIGLKSKWIENAGVFYSLEMAKSDLTKSQTHRRHLTPFSSQRFLNGSRRQVDFFVHTGFQAMSFF